MTAHVNDFLEPEPFIVARLQQALADMQPKVHVLTAADMARMKESAQLVPAVHVLWRGFRVLESNAVGTLSRLMHTWLVVAAVRNVAEIRSGAAARAEAGHLIARAGGALMGFRPPNVSSPMQLAPSTPEAGYSAGFMYLPLAFQVETMFRQA